MYTKIPKILAITCLVLAVAHLSYMIIYQWKNDNEISMPWFSFVMAIAAVFLLT